MRVALVHDWLTGMRGGEKVLEEVCLLFPEAPLFTLVHVPGSVSGVIEARTIRTSPLSRWPGVARSYRRFLPLFPHLVEGFDLRGFDLVVSTSHCVAKGAKAPPGAVHVSYVFSPMRYVWDRWDDYFGPGRSDPLTRAAMRALRGPLQAWDRRSAARVDRFLCDSAFVAERIRRYWSRGAEVIPPPADTDVFSPTGEARSGEWLVVAALVAYKRVDLAIRAAEAAGVPLVVVGTGPDEARLRAAASSRVRFAGWASEAELVSYYSRARGLLFPGVEDFGIVPLEAMACGCPVVAYAEGGALETVRGAAWDGDPSGAPREATGLFVREQTVEAFARAILAVEEDRARIDPAACRSRALEFARPAFRRRLAAALTGAGAGPILPN
ncbi:MAG: glycosyltransferase [bacterium]